MNYKEYNALLNKLANQKLNSIAEVVITFLSGLLIFIVAYLALIILL